MIRLRKFSWIGLVILPALLSLPLASQVARKPKAPKRNLAQALSDDQINFIRPGVVVKVVSASIAKDGTITARVNLTDPKGLPLDRDGVTTPGAVSMSFICAYIPAGQKQYVSYTTTVAKATLPGNTNPPQTQAANDSGGTFTKNADGDYTYTFKTKAPANFDATVTHSIGVSAQRNLSEFITYAEWAETANDVFNFVPNGSAVKVIRDVVPTSACNQCHDPMIGHGGSRIKVELCIMCHTPQTINPDTGLTQDMNVLIHKIHMGENLPSVKAGTPYRIWHRGQWSDFSDVKFPSGTDELKTCTVCHQKATQADNYFKAPARAPCGSCHDDVNFATGANHVNLPQVSDNQCADCHIEKGDLEFDASVKGAHTVANRSATLPGIVTQITKVVNTGAGQTPSVTFKVTDKAGNPVDISKLTNIRVVLSGPNGDYQFGPTGIRVSEDPSKTPGLGGVYTYTTTNKIPAGAKGSYTVSIEARNAATLLPGTVKETAAIDWAKPVEYYFAVDASTVAPRRQVVSTEKCSACHFDLTFIHSAARAETQECVICHNPTLTDSSKASVSFASQIHSIHRGSDLVNPYVLGTRNYQDVGFPGDLRDCAVCHVNNSYNPDVVGAVAPIATPGALINPTTPPITAACQGCHDDKATASHAAGNTNQFGESCTVCHGSTSAFSMDKVHSRTQ